MLRRVVQVLSAGATYCWVCGRKIGKGEVVCDSCAKGEQ